MQDDFEQNELKPDRSDRPNHYKPKRQSDWTTSISQKMSDLSQKMGELTQNINISRQHAMIGAGVLILLIIIITIFSSLNSAPKEPVNEPQAITLPSNNVEPATSQPQAVEPPAVVSTDSVSPAPTTEFEPQEPIQQQPTQQRIDVADQPAVSNKPVAPQVAVDKPTAPVVDKPVTTKQQPKVTSKPAVSQPKSLQNLPSNNMVLQLSAASKRDGLEQLARKNNLSQYWIYETRRNNQPWFVLVHGSYASIDEAKRGIKQLPAGIQAQKPWIKPVRQVHQEMKQR